MPILALVACWIIFGLFIGGWLFEYSFEFWATVYKGTPVDIPFWIAMLGGAVMSVPLVPIAVLTLLISMVI
jgi:hypothetical protein